MSALGRARDWLIAPPPRHAVQDAPRPLDRGVPVSSAAVLGRAGEVEPVAAALALALRGATRAKAATVALVGAEPPAADGASATPAARGGGERLEAHGFDARVRGRLAWTRLDAADSAFATAVHRVALVAPPAVLAVAAARTDAIDEALHECDLLVLVTADPDAPLAKLTAAGLDRAPLATVAPLGRGLARALARAGLRPPRAVRQTLTTVPELAR